ncbi:MAG: methyltransferase domain-containing protein [Bacteroidetes bacterium]|nr:methyltransferase domain-containing protein [Bacteroidota bacterium]
MIRKIIKPVYHFSHDLLFQTSHLNPFWKKEHGGKPVIKGHISAEHLADTRLDDQLVDQLKVNDIKVKEYTIDVKGYHSYIKKVNYPESYYGGGLDSEANFTEKTLEHYVSTDFISFDSHTVFIDVAACTSPFYQIVRRLYGTSQTYQQDLIYPKGLHGDKIGGYASELFLPDESVDGITLHCSLEHFEGNSDTEFFQELERVLRPGGKAVILPFYLAGEYTIHVDPAYNLLKWHRPKIDPKARLRYCNWYQFFSRHYDPVALKERIIQKAPKLDLTVYRVTNFKEVDPSCYLRFIGVFEKRP